MGENGVPDAAVVVVLRRRPRRCTIFDGRRTTGGRLTALPYFYSRSLGTSLLPFHSVSLSLPLSLAEILYKICRSLYIQGDPSAC